jgi:hypothetical protein
MLRQDTIPDSRAIRSTGIPIYAHVPPASAGIKVVKPDFDKIAKANELKATWLGHAVRPLGPLPPMSTYAHRTKLTR